MSLDITLTEENTIKCECGREHVLATDYVYDGNITHNLGLMAKEAGIYKLIWRPEELEVTHASQIIEPLTKALKDMQKRPDFYKQFDGENGGDIYEDFIPFLWSYLAACIAHPKALIGVSR